MAEEYFKQYIYTPKRFLKEMAILFLVQLLVVAPNHAGFWNKSKPVTKTDSFVLTFSDKEIMKNSFLSYKAVGGFSSIRSYNVMISCKNGKISVLKSIHNPKRNKRSPTIRQRGSMPKQEYLALWHRLNRQRVFNLPDAPDPKRNLHDEFTFHFQARVGKYENNFKVYGVHRPEAARYFCIKNLLDSASDMSSLWYRHGALAKK